MPSPTASCAGRSGPSLASTSAASRAARGWGRGAGRSSAATPGCWRTSVWRSATTASGSSFSLCSRPPVSSWLQAASPENSENRLLGRYTPVSRGKPRPDRGRCVYGRYRTPARASRQRRPAGQRSHHASLDRLLQRGRSDGTAARETHYFAMLAVAEARAAEDAGRYAHPVRQGRLPPLVGWLRKSPIRGTADGSVKKRAAFGCSRGGPSIQRMCDVKDSIDTGATPELSS